MVAVLCPVWKIQGARNLCADRGGPRAANYERRAGANNSARQGGVDGGAYDCESAREVRSFRTPSATCHRVQTCAATGPPGAAPAALDNGPGRHAHDTAAPANHQRGERGGGAAKARRATGGGAIAGFDGLGAGFEGPQGKAAARNPSDNSLGVGKNEIVQIVNSRLAIFTKKGPKYPASGKALLGPVVSNSLFAGFGGPCEKLTSGDAVVRYDQLANRWLFVLPIFRHPADQPDAPYGMCYAISDSPDPMGGYYRYQFSRPLFPDYPRPAIWTDGYYVPTSTGDTVIQKQLCAADRNKMLKGLAADEQCVIIDGVSFLNAADIDGKRLPPHGSPELVMAAGGTQLHQIFEDDGIYVWKYRVNWDDPSKTSLSGPEKITVAPYRFSCATGNWASVCPSPGPMSASTRRAIS